MGNDVPGGDDDVRPGKGMPPEWLAAGMQTVSADDVGKGREVEEVLVMVENLNPAQQAVVNKILAHFAGPSRNDDSGMWNVADVKIELLLDQMRVKGLIYDQRGVPDDSGHYPGLSTCLLEGLERVGYREDDVFDHGGTLTVKLPLKNLDFLSIGDLEHLFEKEVAAALKGAIFDRGGNLENEEDDAYPSERGEDRLGMVDVLVEKFRELVALIEAVGDGLSLAMGDGGGEVKKEFYGELLKGIASIQESFHAVLEKMLTSGGGDFGNGPEVVGVDVSDEVKLLDRELTRRDMRQLMANLSRARNPDEERRRLDDAENSAEGGLDGTEGPLNRSLLLEALDMMERGAPLGPEFLKVDPKMPISAEFDGENVRMAGQVFRPLGGPESIQRFIDSDVTGEVGAGAGESQGETEKPVEGESHGEAEKSVEGLGGWANIMRKFSYLSRRGLRQHEAAQNSLREAAATYLERLVGISNVGAYNDGDNAADEKPEVGSWDFSGADITVVGSEFRVKGMKGGQYALGSLKRLEEHLETLGVQVEVVKEPYWRPAHTLPPEVKLNFAFDLQEVVKALEQKRG